MSYLEGLLSKFPRGTAARLWFAGKWRDGPKAPRRRANGCDGRAGDDEPVTGTGPAAVSRDGTIREVIEALPVGIVVTRASDGLVMFSNDRARRNFGVSAEEADNLSSLNFYADVADREAILRQLELQGEFNDVEVSLNKADGTPICVSGHGVQCTFRGERAVAAVFTDVTSRREAMHRMRLAQRMETLRRVAGGLAHELNNALVPIITFTELAIDDLPNDSKVKAHLDMVLQGASRCTTLIQKVFENSRARPPALKQVDLRAVANESLELLKLVMPKRITVVPRISQKGSLTVHGDWFALQDVILNVCMNAADAIGDQPGTIDFELQEVHVGKHQRAGNPNVKPGRYVRLVVRDNGVGVDDATLERMFDPFFTIKWIEEGKGMGLSGVHGIVTEHDGDISISRLPDQGTTLSIWLPCGPPTSPKDSTVPKLND